MKTKITLLIFACMAVVSCSKWHYGHGGHDDDDGGSDITFIESEVDEGASKNKPKTELSPNEIVVRFDPSFPDTKRDSLRNAASLIKEPDFCDCGDPNLEFWTLDPDIDEAEIEGVVDRLSRTRPKGGARGDRSFEIILPDVPPFTLQGQGGPDDDAPLIGPRNGTPINIAVIDTGLDFYRYLFEETPEKFLFPSSEFSGCYDTRSGWDFINDTRIIADENGHGTYITKIMTDILDEEGLNYQILPLKVFNREGTGSYWDVLCALSYIKDINLNGGNIDIVNASFGGQLPMEFFERPDGDGAVNVFAQILSELKELGTLVVTSAGNDEINIDGGGPKGDFLSTFKNENLLSVGGYLDDGVRPVVDPVKIHPDSNYGRESVDIALAFNDYMIILNRVDPTIKDDVVLHGTSYAAAAMSALAAKINEEAGGDLSPEELRQLILRLATQSSELNGFINDSRVYLRE